MTNKNSEFKVLVVDDNISLLTTTGLIMKHQGYQVFTSSDGKDALSIIMNNSLDCILMDIKMPGLDGIEVLRKIRRKNQKIKVVLMTGNYEDDLVKEGLNLGAEEVLYKPLEMNSLFQILDRILQPNTS